MEAEEDRTDAVKGSAVKRRLRFVAMAIVAAYVVAWVAANVVLNTGWAKRKIASRVAMVIGVPLEFGRAGVTPLGTLRLKDLRIEVDALPSTEDTAEAGETAAPTPPLFAGKELRVSVGLISLLTKSIRVNSISIEEPVFSLMRAEDGGFLLPEGFGHPGGAGKALAAAETEPGGVEPGGTAAVAGAPPPAQAMPQIRPDGTAGPPGGALALPPDLAKEFEDSKAGMESPPTADAAAVEAGAVSTSQGDAKDVGPEESRPIVIRFGAHDIHFGDLEMRRGLVKVVSMESGKDLLRVEDMEMRVAVGQDRRDEGSFTAKKAVLFDTVEASDMRAKVEMHGLTLQFTEFEGELAEGKIGGAFKAAPFFQGIPFLANLNLEGVTVAALSKPLVNELGMDAGTLEGKVEAIGLLRSPESYQARGEFQVDGAHIDKIGLLAPLSGAIDFKGLEDIDFDEMVLRFSVLGGNIRFDDVRVSSPDIVMSGRGFIGFQGQISLAWRLYVNEKAYHAIRMIEKRLPEGMGMGYQPFGSGERHFRDYLIAGYVSKPMINFWRVDEGVLMDDLRAQIGQLLSRPARE